MPFKGWKRCWWQRGGAPQPSLRFFRANGKAGGGDTGAAGVPREGKALGADTFDTGLKYQIDMRARQKVGGFCAESAA
jgi:hypothetical protein